MKLVLICYNEAIDNEVLQLLDKANVQGYTKWTKVLGVGKTSGPHLYNHIWPKANNVIATVLPNEAALAIFSDIRKLRKRLGTEGLKAFMWQIDDVT